MSSMTVADYMSHHPHYVGPDHSMAAAHRLMRRHKIRHLPILNDGKLVGIVSQRDLYFLESLDKMVPEDVPVSEAMREDVVSVPPTTSIAKVTKLMVETRVGSLIVQNENGGAVVGIFTSFDAIKALRGLTDLGEEILESHTS